MLVTHYRGSRIGSFLHSFSSKFVSFSAKLSFSSAVDIELNDHRKISSIPTDGTLKIGVRTNAVRDGDGDVGKNIIIATVQEIAWHLYSKLEPSLE